MDRVTVAAVMLVKDERDIIEPVVAHLLAHADEVIVSDNGSTDGTRRALAELCLLDDRLVVVDDPEVAYRQAEKTTGLAMRALERGHQWVIPCDADEWWIAQDGRRLADWLAGVPRDTQFVKAAIFNHVPSGLDDPADPNPVRRIRWRQREPLEQRWWKVACRLRPDLTIHQGNHSASTTGTGLTGFGLEIRHFPHRSPEQYVRRIGNGFRAYAATGLPESVGSHWRMHGDPDEPTFAERVAAHFAEWFWSPDPEADTSLVHDPAPLPEGAADLDLDLPDYLLQDRVTGTWRAPRRS